MSNKLHHTSLNIAAVAASTSAAGYAASNVAGDSVDLEWRSTTTAGTSSVTLDLGSSVAILALALNHCNFTTCNVFADNNPTPTTARGALTTYEDDQLRRKGSLELVSVTARYVKFEFSGSPTDGAAFWRIGFAPAFGATLTLPRDAIYPATVEHLSPQVRADLANGRAQTAAVGATRAVLDLQFAATAAQRVERAHWLARAGVTWFDLGAPNERWLQWPVQAYEDRVTRRLDRYSREIVSLRLREAA